MPRSRGRAGHVTGRPTNKSIRNTRAQPFGGTAVDTWPVEYACALQAHLGGLIDVRGRVVAGALIADARAWMSARAIPDGVSTRIGTEHIEALVGERLSAGPSKNSLRKARRYGPRK